jgi:methionyl-tRNA synthetase
MSERYFNGIVQKPSRESEKDKELISNAAKTLKSVGDELSQCKFRKGLSLAMGLAKETNKYLDNNAPWKEFKSDPSEAGSTLYYSLNVVNCLKTILNPYIPFTTEKLNKMLSIQNSISENGWKWDPLEIIPGHQLNKASPLFIKLDASIVEEEISRLDIK